MERSNGQDTVTIPRSTIWTALLVGTAASLIVSYGVAARYVTLGASQWGWLYGYSRPFNIRAVGAALLVTGMFSALLIGLPAPRRRKEWLIVLVWLVAGLAAQGMLRSLTPFTFERIFRSAGANAFYSVAEQYDLRTVLGDFEGARANWPLHAQSNMPGKTVLLSGLRSISTNPSVLPWLVVILSNLGGVLMYVFVRDLFDDRRVALFSLVLYLLVPARLFFLPLMNTVTPVVFLISACLLLRWLQTGSGAYATLLGVALYALVFFEPLPLMMGILFAGLIARAFHRRQITRSQALRHVGLSVSAFAVSHAAVFWLSGFNLFTAFRQIGAHAVEFNAAAARPYGVWIWRNVHEFVFGVGICQALMFALALVSSLRGDPKWSERLLRPLTVVCVCLTAVLAAADLMGVNRAEVIRLWIFLACFFQIPVAYVCARLDGPAGMVIIVATTALHCALGTAMIGFVVP